jgi:hypothetical protein
VRGTVLQPPPEHACDSHVPGVLAAFTSDQLFELYKRPQFIAYLPIIVALILAILLAIRYIERLQASFGSHSPQYAKHAKFHRFSYACVSGIAGAQSILFAKTT